MLDPLLTLFGTGCVYVNSTSVSKPVDSGVLVFILAVNVLAHLPIHTTFCVYTDRTVLQHLLVLDAVFLCLIGSLRKEATAVVLGPWKVCVLRLFTGDVGADWGLSSLPVSSKPSSLEPSPSRGCMSRNLERIPLYAVRTSLPRSLTCLIERQSLSEGLFSKTFHFILQTIIIKQ